MMASMKSFASIALIALLGAGHAVAQSHAPALPQLDRAAKPASAKSAPAKIVKDCSEYGAGFVRVEGTGACVKIGGYMRVEGSR